MAKFIIAVNMEFVRSADKPFEWGIVKAAELGYEYVEPMVHWGRAMGHKTNCRLLAQDTRVRLLHWSLHTVQQYPGTETEIVYHSRLVPGHKAVEKTDVTAQRHFVFVQKIKARN